MSENNELKTIVITGATSGIGEFLSRKLADKNHSLILTGRNQEKLENLKSELQPLCKGVVVCAVDFSSPKEVNAFASQFLKDVSVVINSAADFGPVKNVLDVSDKEILQGFQVNVLAPISLVQQSLPYMIQNGYGRIINIGSTGGLGGYPLRTPYCLSKNALVAFTKTLNGEIYSGEYGKGVDIKSFCVCPGPVKGERLEKQIRTRAEYKSMPIEESRKKFEAILGRVLEPEEVTDKIIELLKSGDNLKGQDVITF